MVSCCFCFLLFGSILSWDILVLNVLHSSEISGCMDHPSFYAVVCSQLAISRSEVLQQHAAVSTLCLLPAQAGDRWTPALHTQCQIMPVWHAQVCTLRESRTWFRRLCNVGRATNLLLSRVGATASILSTFSTSAARNIAIITQKDAEVGSTSGKEVRGYKGQDWGTACAEATISGTTFVQCSPSPSLQKRGQQQCIHSDQRRRQVLELWCCSSCA